MIPYEFGTWGIGLALRLHGSVFPHSCLIALPGAILSYVAWELQSAYHIFLDEGAETKGLVALWGSFTFTLGFLLVFRTQIAYSRYWSGCGLLMGVRTVWFNAASNLISFCSTKPELAEEVTKFQRLLVRLFSLMYCTALQQVAVIEDERFSVLDGDDDEMLDPQRMMFYFRSSDRSEVVMQWIQRLIVDKSRSGVIDIAPPILSRVFQELSNGVGDVYQATCITEYQFPFPYAQMVTLMLLLHFLFTPVICALAIPHIGVAVGIAFSSILGLWSLNFIGAEIEMPFGEDANDLPVHELQDGFNRKLCALMTPLAQLPPYIVSPKAEKVGANALLPRPIKHIAALCMQPPMVASNSMVEKSKEPLETASVATSVFSAPAKNTVKHSVLRLMGRTKSTMARKAVHWSKHSTDWHVTIPSVFGEKNAQALDVADDVPSLFTSSQASPGEASSARCSRERIDDFSKHREKENSKGSLLAGRPDYPAHAAPGFGDGGYSDVNGVGTSRIGKARMVPASRLDVSCYLSV